MITETITFEIIQLVLGFLVALLLMLIFYKLGRALGASDTEKKWQVQMNRIRKEIADSSRSIIRGQVSEQLAPYLPDFPFDPAACKFLGSPVDFVVFHKLDDPDNRAIVLVEVKTGKSGLNQNEQLVKTAIEQGRVYYYEYRFNPVK